MLPPHSLDPGRSLIGVPLGEQRVGLVLERVLLWVPENESVEEAHQGEVGQRVTSVLDLHREVKRFFATFQNRALLSKYIRVRLPEGEARIFPISYAVACFKPMSVSRIAPDLFRTLYRLSYRAEAQ